MTPKTWRERLDARISYCPLCAHWQWDGRCTTCEDDS